MSDLPPGTPRTGSPALPYPSGDRQQFLAQLLADLARTHTADGKPFGLHTRAPGDPTVALLDAWATVADVIAFYQDRIANEGFLRTAGQPGSLLAIAQLVGYRPRPGLAASVWLAYSLHPDPAATAVVLPAGLLAQSVPGTGELPQTFETTEELVARPGWNTLTVRTTGPVTAPPEGLSALTTLALQGVTTGLSANDVILLSDGAAAPTPVLVQAVSPDLASQVTTVTLQSPDASTPAGTAPAQAAPACPGTVVEAIDNLVPGLSVVPATPPPSAAALNRGPAEVLAAGSDAIPRLMTALHPALAGTLYKALGMTSIGTATVTAAQALRVRATPFGARTPPRPIVGSLGQPGGTEEWPIGDQQVLSAQMTWGDGVPIGRAQVSIQGPDGICAQAVAGLSLPVSVPLSSPAIGSPAIGTITVTSTPAGGTPDVITVTFEPAAPGLVTMTVTLTPASDRSSVMVTFDDSSGFTWVPALRAAERFTVGNYQVTIGWSAGGAAAGTGTTGQAGGEVLSVSVTEALPLATPTVLDLDTTYPGILPGSWVAIAGPAGEAPGYPVIAQVTSAATAAVSHYRKSGTVTRLSLDRPWIDGNARWLSAARPLSVHAQSAALTLRPVALPGPLAGSAIDLDGLYAGLAAGQRILVTGTRSDLPLGAAVPAGEPAMITAVTHLTTAGTADTPHTTLQLAARLAYRYELPSVRIYGNVVPAHQGATVTEPLTGAAPGDPRPSFTLSQAPVLADPSAGASGSASSLQLSVGGRTWTPVTRLDVSTPPDSYLTGIDSQGRTTIELGSALPAGTASVVATYRTGQGSAGNVRAHQVTQLLSRPLAVTGVDNPLPGSGGSDGDGPGDVRAGAPAGLACLGRLVSVADAADLVLSWAGVGKASAVPATDGGGEVVALTVAGVDPVALDATGALCTALAGALAAAGGGPSAPVAVLPARLYLIVLAASVRCDPALAWAGVSAALQAAFFGAFGYRQRHLGEDVIISNVVAVAHSVPGVESFSVTAITLVPTTATASEIAALTASLPAPPASGRLTLPVPPAADGPPAAAVAYLSDAMTDTLIVQQVVH